MAMRLAKINKLYNHDGLLVQPRQQAGCLRGPEPPSHRLIRRYRSWTGPHVARQGVKASESAAGSTADLQEHDCVASEPLVDKVLTLIKGSDGGDDLSQQQRDEVDACLSELEAQGEQKSMRPLNNPLIFGNYNVAYVSTGQSQAGQPAGGRFRSGLGKLLFRTTLLAQSVLQPDIVTNKVEFKLFGLIPGSVGLRGRFVSIPEVAGEECRDDTVKVFFESPVLSLPSGIHVRIGPESSVVLKTTFVDERVRLGKGSRGSRFVFTRGGAADIAGMDSVGLQQCSKLGKAVLMFLIGGLLFNGILLAARPALPVVIRAAGIVQFLLGTAIGGVCWRGGIIQDNEDRPEVAKPVGSSIRPATPEA